MVDSKSFFFSGHYFVEMVVPNNILNKIVPEYIFEKEKKLNWRLKNVKMMVLTSKPQVKTGKVKENKLHSEFRF